MTNIIYIPLDERPVNREFPPTLVASNQELNIISPPLCLLGSKKTPAPTKELWDWLETYAEDAHVLVASLDQLIYGGIVPSRLHHLTKKQVDDYLQRLVRLKRRLPKLEVYIFNLIMRVPAYNSSDEEPSYYANFGEKIYRWGWLADQLGRGQGGQNEQQELDQLVASIPDEVKDDYLKRRNLNHYLNTQAIQLAKEGIVDFLVIPLDDCAEYGFSAAEQRNLLKLVEADTLQQKIHIYPGADEVGSTLICRIYNKLQGRKPRIFVRYSSTSGPQIVPRYEDRPLGESIKSQITVCGGVMVDNSLEADVILMVNSPTLSGRAMQEAAQALTDKDTSYYSSRNLREFAESINYYLEMNRKVALADVSFGNGADHELMRLLGIQGTLPKLLSFGAWNTPGNTLGTVIAHALIRLDVHTEKARPDKFLVDRYVEDWGYQVLVRTYLREHAETLGISYFDLGDRTTKIESLALRKLQMFIDRHLSDFSTSYKLNAVHFPWNRLFEIGLDSEFR